ncbi:MAG: DUF502 domain-containing protein [Proteobacteria bacterium]|nr:DUF502 domain-containing protein [Pseudomonadota bacterium]
MSDKSDPPSDKKPEGQWPRGPLIQPAKKTLLRRLRNYLVTGIIVTAPIGITLWLIWAFVSFVDQKILPLLPEKYRPEEILQFSVPGIGVLIVLVFLILAGMFTSGFVGRFYLRIGERLLDRMPVVRHVYGALKQVFEAVLSQKERAFREVVLVEYPRRGIWVLGFVTSTSKGEIQNRFDETVANVFVPTTPNPTSGFLLFVPRGDLIHLDLTIEEGAKLVISGGIVTPPDRRSSERQTAESVTAYGGDPAGRSEEEEPKLPAG